MVFRYSLNKIKCLSCLIIALSVTKCLALDVEQSTPQIRSILAQFTKYAEQSRKDWKVPGMAVAIVKNDKVIYARGFGVRNENKAPVTVNTIFDIASLTKSFTATLLAMQIDQGKYNWDTKVTALYPQFKLYDLDTTKKFEVQDLLAHDSGLPEGALNSLIGDFGYDFNHALYALRFIKPVARFRTKFAYQDIFPMLAGRIIEKTSGKSFTDNLHQNLFDPLQMTYSYGDEEKIYQLNDRAQPFYQSYGKLYAYPMNSSYSSKLRTSGNGTDSSGGIYSNALDMAKWLIFNINNGAYNNTQLVGKKNMQVIHSPQTLIKNSSANANLNGESEQSYGIGWFIDKKEYQPYTVLYHPGGGTGMHALMAYIPEEKVGIIILTNTWGNKVPETLYRKFFDLYLNKKPLKDWNRAFLQEKMNQNKLTPEPSICNQHVTSPDLNKYIGIYHNPVYGNLQILKQGNHLILSIGPIGVIWELSYCKDNTLKAYWPNPYGMKFQMLTDGQNLVEFTEKSNRVVKMTIPFLNGDGSGHFIKK
jgi:CubicO group peptidase (beta-lactamase class C family)